MNGFDAVDPDEFLTRIAADLDSVAAVPDDVLNNIVTRDGACMDLYRSDEQPEWSGEELTDRQAAARICGACPVQRECLELVLRTSGAATLGVWGALPAEDVRELYPVWLARHPGRADRHGGTESGERS
jgi:WhiB family redox-sensing transcriptional regulator